MSSYPRLKEDCTFDELKEWSMGFANHIGSSHLDGHTEASVLVTLSVLYEALVGEMLQKSRNLAASIAASDRLSDEDRDRFLRVVSGVERGESPAFDHPTKEELLEVDPALGAAFGILALMDAQGEAFGRVNVLKMLMATTMLSDSEKANSLHEIGECFGFDELSDEQKRELRNHLKAGTTDPLPIPTENDVDDACDSLFG